MHVTQDTNPVEGGVHARSAGSWKKFEELAADDGDEPFAFPQKVSKVCAATIFTVIDRFVGYPDVTIGQFPHYPVLESVASLVFVSDPWEKVSKICSRWASAAAPAPMKAPHSGK